MLSYIGTSIACPSPLRSRAKRGGDRLAGDDAGDMVAEHEGGVARLAGDAAERRGEA